MIPIGLRQTGDAVMWHNTEKSKLKNKIVNTFSQKIPGDKWGYCHSAIIYHNVSKIIHATTPHAKIETLKSEKGISLELWRCEKLTVAQRAMIASNMEKICFKSNGKPRKYDWLAIVSLGNLNNPWKLHCAEAVAIAIRDSGGNVFPKYLINSVIQPNQIILSGYMKLIYQEEVL